MMTELNSNLFRSTVAAPDVSATLATTAPQEADNKFNLLAKLLVILRGGAGANADSAVVSTALEASKVIKATAGRLMSLAVYNSGPAQFILIHNAASVPANGAGTLLYPPIPVGAAGVTVIDFPRPLVATTGITVCNSSTAPSKTLGAADCFFHAQID